MVPLFVLQFLIHPLLSADLTENDYGILLNIIALVSLVGVTFGNVLNNSRLISQKWYDKQGVIGDYNVMLLCFVCLNLIVMTYYMSFGNISGSGLELMMLIVLSVLMIVNGYISVEFRIKLNYLKFAKEGFCLGFGYVVGYVLYTYTGYWHLIYLVGVLFSFTYLVINTSLLNESVRVTSNLKGTVKRTLALLVSGLLVSLGTYLDRIILLPLVGGKAVSVYFVATLLGKTLGLAVGPLSGLLLSYLAPRREAFNREFTRHLLLGLLLCIISYVIINCIDEYILRILYHKQYKEAIGIVPVATASVLILLLCNLLNSYVLNFTSSLWQVVINIAFVLSYLVLSIIFFKAHGLIGFSIGILFASLLKLVLIIILFYSRNHSLVKNYV